MSAKTAKWIFYLGTLISAALFLGLTVDTHRQIQSLTHADQLNEQVVAGALRKIRPLLFDHGQGGQQVAPHVALGLRRSV